MKEGPKERLSKSKKRNMEKVSESKKEKSGLKAELYDVPRTLSFQPSISSQQQTNKKKHKTQNKKKNHRRTKKTRRKSINK